MLDPERNVYVACHCLEEKLTRLRQGYIRGLYDKAKMPLSLRRCFLDNMDMRHPDTKHMVEAAQEFAQRKGPPVLVLMGGSGNGKTHVAAALACIFIDHLTPAYFAYVPSMLDEMRAAYREEQRYYDLLEQAKSTELLVLDDVGAHKGTAWADEQLDKIVNHRLMYEMRTIITTNLELKELPTRMASRLTDGSVCRLVTTKAPDYRFLKGRT